MNILTAGHKYELENFENKDQPGQVLQFIEKTPVAESSTELKTVNDGTTNEEVLEVLINRLTFLQEKFPCEENAEALAHLDDALGWLYSRTSDRKARGVEGKQFPRTT